MQPPSRSISRMARSARSSDTEFWVLQNGRWSDLTARAYADHVTDEVTVTLVDGGAGDEDRSADGVIADPGGPGVPRAPWTFTVTVSASVDPAADFNFFLEECSELGSTTACTPQTPRLWVDPLAFGPTITDPEPVTAERRGVLHLGPDSTPTATTVSSRSDLPSPCRLAPPRRETTLRRATARVGADRLRVRFGRRDVVRGG